jgi:ABC-type sugar transport system permease subunit
MAYNEPGWLDLLAAWLLALLWILPLLYAVWTAFHPAEYSTRFDLGAPLTLDNFRRAWAAAPFARYFFNTTLLVGMILVVQLVLSTLAAYAFARLRFRGRDLAFALVLMQLIVMPDILVVQNYKTMAQLGLIDWRCVYWAWAGLVVWIREMSLTDCRRSIRATTSIAVLCRSCRYWSRFCYSSGNLYKVLCGQGSNETHHLEHPMVLWPGWPGQRGTYRQRSVHHG